MNNNNGITAQNIDTAVVVHKAKGLLIINPPGNTPKPTPNIDWKKVCQEALKTRNEELTTNPFTRNDGIEFDLDEIYVPLRLKVKKDQISGKISPKSRSQMFQANNDFFDQILKPQILKEGSKLAIVGKAGAGKTTLLRKIAKWVTDEKEYLAIWVSLADLDGQTIKNYLLQKWLVDALPVRVTTPEMEQDLIDQFTNGRVFLLLDGIDEMASKTPLTKLKEEISSGWLASAKVVVTCRQNFWDARSNPLKGFDVYRNLGFEYPDGIKTFIEHWFAKNLKLGEQLMKELDQPGKERIPHMVRNPLRLALLCRTWEVRQGNLPETKADLYKEFTDTLYDWKRDSNNEKFNIDEKCQEELNIALSQLALLGMEQSECRFRFKKSLVKKVLGDTLLNLALDLGLLNLLKNQDEVYTFYHPTFQEYFAALEINDWSYFLKPNDPCSGTCRIFEKQWKEVILLWFGRDDVEKKKKEAFIEKLIKLDNLDKSDKYRAYFLAGAIVREFKESRWGDEIVDEIVSIYFMNLDVSQEEVKAVLLETDKDRAINSLNKLLKQTSDQEKYKIITNCLRDIAVGDQKAINPDMQTPDQDNIVVGHEGAIHFFLKLLEQTSSLGNMFQNKEPYQRTYKFFSQFIENFNYQKFYKPWNKQQTTTLKSPNNPDNKTPLTQSSKEQTDTKPIYQDLDNLAY